MRKLKNFKSGRRKKENGIEQGENVINKHSIIRQFVENYRKKKKNIIRHKIQNKTKIKKLLVPEYCFCMLFDPFINY